MEKDKRYLVFGYDDYYPLGGMTDNKDSFATIIEAIKYIAESGFENYDLYDRIKGLEIDLEKYMKTEI